MFSINEPKPAPPPWPSPFHNKCTNLACRFPNPPKTTKGLYQCAGMIGVFSCEGFYRVSGFMARKADKYINEQAHLAEQPHCLEEMTMEEEKAELRELVASCSAPGRSSSLRSTSKSRCTRSSPASQLPSTRFTKPWLDPNERRKAREYRQDCYMRQLYPSFSIRQRWI